MYVLASDREFNFFFGSVVIENNDLENEIGDYCCVVKFMALSTLVCKTQLCHLKLVIESVWGNDDFDYDRN